MYILEIPVTTIEFLMFQAILFPAACNFTSSQPLLGWWQEADWDLTKILGVTEIFVGFLLLRRNPVELSLYLFWYNLFYCYYFTTSSVTSQSSTTTTTTNGSQTSLHINEWKMGCPKGHSSKIIRTFKVLS